MSNQNDNPVRDCALNVWLNHSGSKYPMEALKLCFAKQQFTQNKYYVEIFAKLFDIFQDNDDQPTTIQYTSSGIVVNIDFTIFTELNNDDKMIRKMNETMQNFLEELPILLKKDSLDIKYEFGNDGYNHTIEISFDKSTGTVNIYDIDDRVKNVRVDESETLSAIYKEFLKATKPPQNGGRLSISKKTRKSYNIPANMNVLEAIQDFSKKSTKAKLADLLGLSKSTKLSKIELATKVLTTNK